MKKELEKLLNSKNEKFQMLLTILLKECDKYNKKKLDRKSYQHEYYLKITKAKRREKVGESK